jgi:plasmid stability protein
VLSSNAVGDLKVRNLDDRVTRALKARAKARGLSMEEEARQTLAESASRKREALARRAAASRAASRKGRNAPPSDSAAIIRRERDAWG